MPMPIATQPKPAAKPAAAPKAMVVVGALRNMARLKDITRLRMKLMAKIFGVLAGGAASAKPLAFSQTLPKRNGAYQRPPRRKAERAATRMAQRLRVCMFIG
jgi:hypothetical protein